MKKFYISIFLCVTIIFSLYSCEQQIDNITPDNDYQDDQNQSITDDYDDRFTYHIENDNVILDGYVGDEKREIIIPSEIQGYNVIEINDGAFYNKTFIENIVFPDSVRKFGKGILSGCYNLKSIKLPFIGSTPQKKDDIYTSNFGYIFGDEPYSNAIPVVQYYYNGSSEYVDSSTYYLPEGLESVYITGANSPIPYSAFYNCEKIKKFYIGKEVSDIYRFAFSGCYGKIMFENPVINKISEYAFADYKGDEFKIPLSVTVIESYAFGDCEHLKTIDIPDNVIEIEPYAFRGCFDADQINIGKNVKILPANCFYYNIKVERVSIPDGVVKISEQAFMGCKKLKEIVLPASLSYIGENCFDTCPELEKVYFNKFSGWKYYNNRSIGGSLSETALKSASSAANYLKNTYRNYIWERF